MKKIYAEEFNPLVGRFFDEPHNPKGYDKKVNTKINELYKLLDRIKPNTFGDDAKIIYISFPRGGIKYYYDYEELKRYGEVDNYLEYEKNYQEDYPDNIVWYKLITTKYKNYRYIGLDNHIIIYADMNEKPDLFENERLNKLLSYIIIKVKECLVRLENNTYNDYVLENLPYKKRFGVIKRCDYWKIYPKIKANLLEKITQDKINFFIKNAKDKVDERITNMTANKYFYCVHLAYQSLGYEIGNLSDIELYKKYADNRDEGLTQIDLDSEKEFLDWYNDKSRWGGHPWEIIPGPSYARINLMVGHDDKGYYLSLDGSRILMQIEIVKIYFELTKNNIPIRIFDPDIIKESLLGKDYLGIVPEYLFLIYCESHFEKFKPKQFIHLDNKNILKYAKWEDIEKLYLK